MAAFHTIPSSISDRFMIKAEKIGKFETSFPSIFPIGMMENGIGPFNRYILMGIERIRCGLSTLPHFRSMCLKQWVMYVLVCWFVWVCVRVTADDGLLNKKKGKEEEEEGKKNSSANATK